VIAPPKVSFRMRRYREECGFHLFPPLRPMRELLDGQPPAVWDRAMWFVWASFAGDPYRPIDETFRLHLRERGYRISGEMFARVAEALRGKGLTADGQWNPSLLVGWEREWRRCKRERLFMARPDDATGGPGR
jgi:hypothetical protein